MRARATVHNAPCDAWGAAGSGRPLPIPDSFPQQQENQDVNYTFLTTAVDGGPVAEGRWSRGPSIDGRGEFTQQPARPMGDEPVLSSPPPESYDQSRNIQGSPGQSPDVATQRPEQQGGGLMEKAKHKLS